MAISFDEFFYMPEDLLKVTEDIIIDRLVGKTLWCMTAREDSLLGAVVYSIMPDKENTILEYVYIKEGNPVGIELLTKSIITLKAHEIFTISIFLDDRYWPLELKGKFVRGLSGNCEFNKFNYFCYDYTQLENSDIMDNLDDVEVYTNELGYIDDEFDADAWDVRDILSGMNVSYSIHEQNNGVGRFFLDDDKKLIGVALGRSDDAENYFVTDYYDTDMKENASVYRRMILGIIRDYLLNSNRESYMEIVCNNRMMESFLTRNFGNAKECGEVLVYTINLKKI